MARKEDKDLTIRQPVVVLVGHTDHGKTALLSAVKDFGIVQKETGGITQHIGAYEVEEKGKKITFIDTPGHEAFFAMRARGAKVADIAVLVVAADAGVQPQTREAILHIKKAGIPFIVGLNKMDKPGADPEKVRRELAAQRVEVEELGGKVPSVEISAKTGQGVKELLDLILLVAEMEELKADILKPGAGVIIESLLDEQRGPTATLLLEQGILRPGEVVATSSAWGKIKRLEDFQGQPLKEVGPGRPALVLGFKQVPGIGERFQVFPGPEQAMASLEKREKEKPVFVAEPGQKVLNLILKADVLGSLEPLQRVLEGLVQEDVKLRVLTTRVGNINEDDLKLARSAKAQIIGFRVKASGQVWRLAKEQGVRIFIFDLIYDFVEHVRKALARMVEPKMIRTDLGKVKVLVVFISRKRRQIIGGRVSEGEIKQGALLEVWREEEEMGRGKIINLQKNKKDVERLARGEECGILYEGSAKIEKGDTLVIYQEEKRKKEL